MRRKERKKWKAGERQMRMKKKGLEDDVKGGERDNHLQSRKRDCVYAVGC